MFTHCFWTELNITNSQTIHSFNNVLQSFSTVFKCVSLANNTVKSWMKNGNTSTHPLGRCYTSNQTSFTCFYNFSLSSKIQKITAMNTKSNIVTLSFYTKLLCYFLFNLRY